MFSATRMKTSSPCQLHLQRRFNPLFTTTEAKVKIQSPSARSTVPKSKSGREVQKLTTTTTIYKIDARRGSMYHQLVKELSGTVHNPDVSQGAEAVRRLQASIKGAEEIREKMESLPRQALSGWSRFSSLGKILLWEV